MSFCLYFWGNLTMNNMHGWIISSSSCCKQTNLREIFFSHCDCWWEKWWKKNLISYHFQSSICFKHIFLPLFGMAHWMSGILCLFSLSVLKLCSLTCQNTVALFVSMSHRIMFYVLRSLDSSQIGTSLVSLVVVSKVCVRLLTHLFIMWDITSRPQPAKDCEMDN